MSYSYSSSSASSSSGTPWGAGLGMDFLGAAGLGGGGLRSTGSCRKSGNINHVRVHGGNAKKKGQILQEPVKEPVKEDLLIFYRSRCSDFLQEPVKEDLNDPPPPKPAVDFLLGSPRFWRRRVKILLHRGLL